MEEEFDKEEMVKALNMVLGEEYEVVDTIEDDTRVGLIIQNRQGQPMSIEDVIQKLTEAGVPLEALGIQVDAVEEPLDEKQVVERYGKTAVLFVNQLGHQIALEWSDAYETLTSLVGHLKEFSGELSDEALVHLIGITMSFVADGFANRQYLGHLLEGYRRDQDLTLVDMKQLLRSAIQTVKDGTFDGEMSRSHTEELRNLYIGPDRWMWSWPDITPELILAIWKGELPPADD